MTPAEVRDVLADLNPEALLFDGLEDALIGYATRAPGHVVAIYDFDAIIALLTRDGASEEDALEHFAFNIEAAYVGEHTPMVLHHCRTPLVLR